MDWGLVVEEELRSSSRELYGVYAWFTVIARQSKRVTAYLHITRRRQRQLDEKRGVGRGEGMN